MSLLKEIKIRLNKETFFAYLIVFVLCTLFLGYAPSSIGLGFFIVSSFFFCFFKKCKPHFNFALILPILLYTMFALSLFWTKDKGLTFKGLERTASLFFVPIAFAVIPRVTKKSLNLIFSSFTIANVLLGALFLLNSTIRFFKTKSFSVFVCHELVSVFHLNAIYVSVAFTFCLFF